MLQSIEHALVLIEHMEKYHPECVAPACGRLALECNALLHRAAGDAAFFVVRKSVMAAMKGKWFRILTDRRIFLKGRLQLLFCRLSGRAYLLAYRGAQKK